MPPNSPGPPEAVGPEVHQPRYASPDQALGEWDNQRMNEVRIWILEWNVMSLNLCETTLTQKTTTGLAWWARSSTSGSASFGS